MAGATGRMIIGAAFSFSAPAPVEAWAVGRLGEALLTTYNLVFETLSVVLLLAIVGAILIAQKEGTTSNRAGGGSKDLSDRHGQPSDTSGAH